MQNDTYIVLNIRLLYGILFAQGISQCSSPDTLSDDMTLLPKISNPYAYVPNSLLMVFAFRYAVISFLHFACSFTRKESLAYCSILV